MAWLRSAPMCDMCRCHEDQTLSEAPHPSLEMRTSTSPSIVRIKGSRRLRSRVTWDWRSARASAAELSPAWSEAQASARGLCLPASAWLDEEAKVGAGGSRGVSLLIMRASRQEKGAVMLRRASSRASDVPKKWARLLLSQACVTGTLRRIPPVYRLCRSSRPSQQQVR